jgi:hypothetical protein
MLSIVGGRIRRSRPCPLPSGDRPTLLWIVHLVPGRILPAELLAGVATSAVGSPAVGRRANRWTAVRLPSLLVAVAASPEGKAAMANYWTGALLSVSCSMAGKPLPRAGARSSR